MSRYIYCCCVFVQIYPWFASVPDEDEDAKKVKTRSTVPKTGFHALHGDNINVTHITVKELNLRLRRLVHQCISDLIDPAR